MALFFHLLAKYFSEIIFLTNSTSNLLSVTCDLPFYEVRLIEGQP